MLSKSDVGSNLCAQATRSSFGQFSCHFPHLSTSLANEYYKFKSSSNVSLRFGFSSTRKKKFRAQNKWMHFILFECRSRDVMRNVFWSWIWTRRRWWKNGREMVLFIFFSSCVFNYCFVISILSHITAWHVTIKEVECNNGNVPTHRASVEQ